MIKVVFDCSIRVNDCYIRVFRLLYCMYVWHHYYLLLLCYPTIGSRENHNHYLWGWSAPVFSKLGDSSPFVAAAPTFHCHWNHIIIISFNILKANFYGEDSKKLSFKFTWHMACAGTDLYRFSLVLYKGIHNNHYLYSHILHLQAA